MRSDRPGVTHRAISGREIFWDEQILWRLRPLPTSVVPAAVPASLRPPAPSLRPPAPGLQPPAPSLQPPAPGLQPPAPSPQPPAPRSQRPRLAQTPARGHQAGPAAGGLPGRRPRALTSPGGAGSAAGSPARGPAAMAATAATVVLAALRGFFGRFRWRPRAPALAGGVRGAARSAAGRAGSPGWRWRPESRRPPAAAGRPGTLCRRRSCGKPALQRCCRGAPSRCPGLTVGPGRRTAQLLRFPGAVPSCTARRPPPPRGPGAPPSRFSEQAPGGVREGCQGAGGAREPGVGSPPAALQVHWAGEDLCSASWSH